VSYFVITLQNVEMRSDLMNDSIKGNVAYGRNEENDDNRQNA
jgi:hypothetical protein